MLFPQPGANAINFLSQVLGIVDTYTQLLNFSGSESNILKASVTKLNFSKEDAERSQCPLAIQQLG